MSKTLTVTIEHEVEVADDFILAPISVNDVKNMIESVRSREMADALNTFGTYVDAQVVKLTLTEVYDTKQ